MHTFRAAVYLLLQMISGWLSGSSLFQIRLLGWELTRLGTEHIERKFYAALEVGNIEEAKMHYCSLVERVGELDPIVCEAAAILNNEIFFQEQIEEERREQGVKDFLQSNIKTTNIDIENDPDLEPTVIQMLDM